MPPGADFEVVDVDDPYGCGAPYNTLSMYRRPLPTTNLAFLSTVMWDGRETVTGQAIRSDLVTQARDATTGHAEGTAPTAAQLQAIVAFELVALRPPRRRIMAPAAFGRRRARRAGDDRTPAVLHRHQRSAEHPAGDAGRVRGVVGRPNPNVFSLFGAWEDAGSPHRQAIARGEKLFNTRTVRHRQRRRPQRPAPGIP